MNIEVIFKKGDKNRFNRVMEIAKRDGVDIIAADDSGENNLLTFWSNNKTSMMYFKNSINMLGWATWKQNK